MICTEILPDRFFNFRKNILKNTLATPNFKIQPNKIKGFRGCFLKVRKTGKDIPGWKTRQEYHRSSVVY
ncbi:hypothetical protein ES708_24124 [subsurface metagenome]